ncbi:MAG TPA: hypothetical protein VGC41_27570 [Kofleriaceae bacterium]
MKTRESTIARMSRRRQIDEVLAVLELAIATDNGDNEALIELTMETITTGDGCYAEQWSSWSADALRSVLRAHAENAPAVVFRTMRARARKQAAWLRWWIAKGRDETSQPRRAA